MSEEPDTTPRQRPSPFRKRYVGVDGMIVVASYDGERILVTAAEETPPSFQQESAPEESADEFADMDFLAEAAEDDDVHINAGEASYSSWGSSAGFGQDIYLVPESTVSIPDSDARKYIWLIITMRTYTSTAANKQTPWEELGGGLFARFTEWQGIDEDEPPVYLVNELLEMDSERDVFRCLIASVLDGAVYPHHIGAITLSQGYIANVVAL